MTATDDHPHHLSVSIVSGQASSAMCSIGDMAGMLKAVSPMFDSPIPTLHAPAGSQIAVSLSPPSLGRTSARITSKADAQALLAGFASQFADAGWTPGAKAGANGIASQTFERSANNQQWECALMIYPVSGSPGTYLAFIEPTNLTINK